MAVTEGITAAIVMTPSPQAKTVSNAVPNKGRVINIDRWALDFEVEVTNMPMDRMMQNMQCMQQKEQRMDMMDQLLQQRKDDDENDGGEIAEPALPFTLRAFTKFIGGGVS
jgi:hypothetical protein